MLKDGIEIGPLEKFMPQVDLGVVVAEKFGPPVDLGAAAKLGPQISLVVGEGRRGADGEVSCAVAAFPPRAVVVVAVAGFPARAAAFSAPTSPTQQGAPAPVPPTAAPSPSH